MPDEAAAMLPAVRATLDMLAERMRVRALEGGEQEVR